MIRNLIFDFGGVLIDWNPRYLYASYFQSKEEMELFLRRVGFDQWNAELDAGIEWRDSRLDFSGFASRAGSSVRTAGGSVKMSWRLNLL